MEQRRTVLLADTSTEFRILLREAMEKTGEFRVEIAQTGDEVLEKVQGCIGPSPAAAGALSQRPLGPIKTATSVHASGHPAKRVRSRQAEPVQR